MNRPTRSSPGPLLIALAYVGFVSLGLPDAVIGVAWPTVRDTFRLHQGAVGIVFVASGFGYFIPAMDEMWHDGYFNYGHHRTEFNGFLRIVSVS